MLTERTEYEEYGKISEINNKALCQQVKGKFITKLLINWRRP